jgi:hypothetical protein
MLDGMDIEKPSTPNRTISVLIRVTPEMHAQLTKLAEKVGGVAGVATVMRQIVENALAEGIKVGPNQRNGTRPNGRAHPEV